MTQAVITKRWTTKDLEALPYDEWNYYEITNGELFVTRAAHYNYHFTCYLSEIFI